MKKFCQRLGLFVILQTGLFLGALTLHDADSDANYLASTVDKHRLLQRTPAPKIILIGGSNLAFGIDSARLEQDLKMPVVNMGLVAGLGLHFMLNEIAPSVAQGDLIILSLEYEQFSGRAHLLNLKQILEYRPASVWFLRPNQILPVLIEGGLGILSGIVKRSLPWAPSPSLNDSESNSPYARSGFNYQGDLIAHHALPSTWISPASTPSLVPARPGWLPSNDVLEHLSDFARFCQTRGATLFFSAPPQPVPLFASEAPTVQAIFASLRALPLLRFLDVPGDHAYDPSLFYDTGYHLTQEGARRRTAKIVAALNASQRPEPPR